LVALLFFAAAVDSVMVPKQQKSGCIKRRLQAKQAKRRGASSSSSKKMWDVRNLICEDGIDIKKSVVEKYRDSTSKTQVSYSLVSCPLNAHCFFLSSVMPHKTFYFKCRLRQTWRNRHLCR
jgi:hypothetical protein